MTPEFSRVWAMPSSSTFDVPPIAGFVKKYLMKSKLSVDPFARNKRWATYTNDLNPDTAAQEHLEAREFLRRLELSKVKADLILFDPPYSPRQIQEHYASAGLRANHEDTQSGRLCAQCRDYFRKPTTHDAVVLSFGWNSTGMGKGWNIEEILLVSHGGGHNDTICMAERRLPESSGLFPAQP